MTPAQAAGVLRIFDRVVWATTAALDRMLVDLLILRADTHGFTPDGLVMRRLHEVTERVAHQRMKLARLYSERADLAASVRAGTFNPSLEPVRVSAPVATSASPKETCP